ncbi:hypothetical protein TNCT_136261 [Trichonephila clavata]|uniref:Uncharacterized protein n=1 Tax=Trichonephila clavata TaxID=2740835 RepID=A0A8X6KYQ6_TRICU|nr:hypothetical protein TNCT_136261 [Trichonephila clavata]
MMRLLVFGVRRRDVTRQPVSGRPRVTTPRQDRYLGLDRLCLLVVAASSPGLLDSAWFLSCYGLILPACLSGAPARLLIRICLCLLFWVLPGFRFRWFTSGSQTFLAVTAPVSPHCLWSDCSDCGVVLFSNKNSLVVVSSTFCFNRRL